MVFRFAVVALFFFCCLRASSQAPKVDVSGKPLDKTTIETLQLLNPYFNLSADSVTMFELVAKYYVLNRYLNGLAEKDGLDKDKNVAERISVSNTILDEKILAEQYRNNKLAAIVIS